MQVSDSTSPPSSPPSIRRSSRPNSPIQPHASSPRAGSRPASPKRQRPSLNNSKEGRAGLSNSREGVITASHARPTPSNGSFPATTETEFEAWQRKVWHEVKGMKERDRVMLARIDEVAKSGQSSKEPQPEKLKSMENLQQHFTRFFQDHIAQLFSEEDKYRTYLEEKLRRTESDILHLTLDLEKVRTLEAEEHAARISLEESNKVHTANIATLQKYTQTLYTNNVVVQEGKATLLKQNQELQESKRALQDETRTLHEALRTEREENARKLRDLKARRTDSTSEVTVLQKNLEQAQRDADAARKQLKDKEEEHKNELNRQEQHVVKNKTISSELAHEVASLRTELQKRSSGGIGDSDANARVSWEAEKARLEDETARQQEGITQLLLEHEKKVGELEELRARVRTLESALDAERRKGATVGTSSLRVSNSSSYIKDESEGFLSLL